MQSLISFIFILLKILVIVVPLLISVAYFTLAERKILGAIQRRRGPNVIGVFGILQPLADGLKLFINAWRWIQIFFVLRIPQFRPTFGP